MLSRRRLLRCSLLVAALAAAALPLASCLISSLGGAFDHAPEELEAGLSPGAKALVAAALSGLGPPSGERVDWHVHLAGTGAGGTGNFVHPHMLTWLHPIERLRFKVYMSAAGVSDEDRADEQLLGRLVALARAVHPPSRHTLLAFDKHYREDGTVFERATELYVPNEWVFAAAEKHEDLFRPGISVHPYRKDALEELEKWAKKGGKVVKWLPNAQGMDPMSERCVPFYRKMREHGMILLAHAGEEQAVHADEYQKLGNPLRLRRALDEGVRVVVAHCASLGEDEDLDAPELPKRPSFELFLRMMGEKRYEGRLFGEISATVQSNRAPVALETLLRRTDLHPRLVDGSDYPLPAVNVVIRTGKIESLGLITEEERARLNEVYDYNPLLFDLVLKRTVHAPGGGERFAKSVFLENAGLR